MTIKKGSSLLNNKNYEKIHELIRQELLRNLQVQLVHAGIPGALLCSTIIVCIVYPVIDTKTFVISWYITILIILAIRGILLLYYYWQPQRYWLHLGLFIASSSLTALMWGVASVILLPENLFLRQASVIIIIAGICAGATQSLQANRVVSITYIVLALVPLVVFLLMQNLYPYTLLSLAIITFILFLLVVSQQGYRNTIQLLKLRYENTILIEELLATTDKLRITNENLKSQIQERKKIQQKLQYLATHDALTGLANRGYLNVVLKQAMARAERQQSSICILFIDLDEFKSINDHYGHDVGDALLQLIAKRLIAIVRGSDSVVRLGGDEFLIICEGINAIEAISIVANKIQRELSQPYEINGYTIEMSSSIGVSIYPQDGRDADALLKCADTRLYEAKAAGKNQYCSYQPSSLRE